MPLSITAWGNRVDLLAGLLFALIVLGRFAQIPNPPSGNDGGNWLALTANLTGTNVRAATTTVYPPLFLVLLLGAQFVLPPLDALRATAALASVLPGAATYLLMRIAGLKIGSLIGALMAFSGFTFDMLAWGGYPQLLGTAFVVASIAALVLFAHTAALRYVLLAGLLGGCAVLSNLLSGLQAIVALPLAYAVANWNTSWASRRFALPLIAMGLAGLVACIPGIPAYMGLVSHAGPEAFNSSGFSSFREFSAYMVKDAAILWATVFAFVPPGLALLLRRRQLAILAAVIGLIVASLGLSLLTSEVRLLHLIQIPGFILFGVVLRDATATGSPMTRTVVATAAALLVLALALTGIQRYERSVLFYQTLDAHVVAGLEWLRANARPGDLAIASPTAHNWQLGWWVEGLAKVPTYSESDPRWLSFPQEREQASIARRVLSNSDPREAATEAQGHGATLLIVDTRDNLRVDLWVQSGRLSGPIEIVYSNPSITIMRVESGGLPRGQLINE